METEAAKNEEGCILNPTLLARAALECERLVRCEKTLDDKEADVLKRAAAILNRLAITSKGR